MKIALYFRIKYVIFTGLLLKIKQFFDRKGKEIFILSIFWDLEIAFN